MVFQFNNSHYLIIDTNSSIGTFGISFVFLFPDKVEVRVWLSNISENINKKALTNSP